MKINRGHYVEYMDRLNVILDVIERHLIEHPVSKKHKKLKRHLEASMEIMWDVYQEAGNIEHKKYKD